jgi:hypothetical protein
MKAACSFFYPEKIINGAVIGLFYIGREKTRRKFAVPAMVKDAFATNAFSGA